MISDVSAVRLSLSLSIHPSLFLGHLCVALPRLSQAPALPAGLSQPALRPGTSQPPVPRSFPAGPSCPSLLIRSQDKRLSVTAATFTGTTLFARATPGLAGHSGREGDPGARDWGWGVGLGCPCGRNHEGAHARPCTHLLLGDPQESSSGRAPWGPGRLPAQLSGIGRTAPANQSHARGRRSQWARWGRGVQPWCPGFPGPSLALGAGGAEHPAGAG